MTTTTRPIDTDELRDRLDDPSLAILDVRPLAAYNGWRLRGEGRGGHIPGAAALPAEWFASVDEPEIARLLAGKGIAPDREVVVYGNDVDDASAVAGALERFGITGARVYDAGFGAWAADESLPVEKLAKYEKLVSIEWLRRVQAG